uniref:JmjC domain-containing protein n=1 Tax=Ralstonia solanacearum TaxID=305 RepID=A0A0S4VUX3_RALSL|nr:protein of unknown function [Ralstonia solanacearum]
MFFWLGPKGAKTPLHRDLGNVFLVLVRGRKLWGDYAPTAGVPLFASRSEGGLSLGRRRPSLHRLRAGLRLGRTGTRPPRRGRRNAAGGPARRPFDTAQSLAC